ncbi:MAG: proline--tRNA ligase [bacterium]|nr:proline--tRNA ligase [bacterium]
MRQSNLFGKTLRQAPKEAQFSSHQLLLRAGFITESCAGRYYFLPLGWRVHEKIKEVIKKEMDSSDAQEMIAPVLHPLGLWKETNRTTSTGFELMRVKDRNGAEFALGGTAEEMFVDLVRKFKLSYKDLPFNLYQFSTKFRDELRPRGGLLRVKEFVMKDAYSFDRDEESFKKTYQKMWKVYEKIFNRLGFETMAIEADNGYIGGEYCHEFVVLSKIGESKFLTSGDGKYAAHEEVAKFYCEDKNSKEKILPLKEVAAKRGPTMDDGVKFHHLPPWQQMKDLMVVNEKGELILAVTRGDLEVNEIKLARLTKSLTLRHATEKEIKSVGSWPGFISPVGLSKKVKVVADHSLRTIKNAYTGANKKYCDLLNVNIGRDYKPYLEGDIAMAKEGYLAPDGKQKLKAGKGIEVGNIFQLGYHYTHLMKGANFTDENGKEKPYYMGCYGIGIGRTMAAIVEKYHDDKGIIWPKVVSPFQVHLLQLENDNKIRKVAGKLYEELEKQGIEVLFDDRPDKTAGEKFADADLIGIPLRIVVSERSLAKDSFEFKQRGGKEIELVPVLKTLAKIKSLELL